MNPHQEMGEGILGPRQLGFQIRSRKSLWTSHEGQIGRKTLKIGAKMAKSAEI